MTEAGSKRGPRKRSWLSTFFYWVLIAHGFKVLFRVLYRLRWEGMEHVPDTGAVVYVSNHQSHIDPPLIGAVLHKRPCGFLARESLFHPKIFGMTLHAIGVIPVNRERTTAGSLRAVEAELTAGRCAVVFPEGTRCRDGATARFKSGAVFLARRTGATVIPIAVEGLHDVWPPRRRFPRLRGRVRMAIGAPIPVEEITARDDREASEMLRRTVESMRMELRGRIRAESGGRLPQAGKGDVAYWERA